MEARTIGQLISGFAVKAGAACLALYVGNWAAGSAWAAVAPVVAALQGVGQ